MSRLKKIFLAGCACLFSQSAFASSTCWNWHFINPVSTPPIDIKGVAKLKPTYARGDAIKLLSKGSSGAEQLRIIFDRPAKIGDDLVAKIRMLGTDSDTQDVPVAGRWIKLDQKKSVAWLMNQKNGWFVSMQIRDCSNPPAH